MRIAAWIFFVLAIGFPVWILWGVYQYGAEASSRGQFVCGMPALAAMLLSFFALVFVGGLTAAFAGVDYRDQPKPRAWPRKLETMFLSLPLMIGIGMIAYTVIWFWWNTSR